VPEKSFKILGIILAFVGFIILCAGAIVIFMNQLIVAIILFSVGGAALIAGITLAAISKNVQNSHLRARRSQLRAFLTEKNGENFNPSNQHWTASPRLSYLVFRLDANMQKDYESGKTVDIPSEKLLGPSSKNARAS
jgi:hypothetical protein